MKLKEQVKKSNPCVLNVPITNLHMFPQPPYSIEEEEEEEERREMK